MYHLLRQCGEKKRECGERIYRFFSVRAALDSDFGICQGQNRGRRRRTEKTGKSVHHIRVFSHHIDVKDGIW